jgi:hypothetical protein
MKLTSLNVPSHMKRCEVKMLTSMKEDSELWKDMSRHSICLDTYSNMSKDRLATK